MIPAGQDVRAPMHRRAWILLAGLAVFPAPARAVPEPSCVDPVRDAIVRLAPSSPDAIQISRLADLDADGRRDLLVWDSGSCGSGGCDFHVSLTNHGCPRWAGWLRGQRVTALRSRHAGVRDLIATESGGSLSWTDARAEHDGVLYQVRERDCSLTAGAESPTCTDWRLRGE